MIRDPGPAVTPFRFRRFRHRSPAKLAPFTIMTRSPLLALALACALLCVAPAFASSAELKSTSGAGGSCAGCTLVVDLIQKIAVQEAGGSAQKAFDYVCANFQGSLSFLAGICDALTGILALPIQLALDAGEIPDVTCKTGALAFLKLCKAEDAKCQLFSGPVKQRAHHFGASTASATSSSASPLEQRAELNGKVRAHLGAFAALLSGRGLAGGLAATSGAQSKTGPHRPTLDLDNDAFSTAPTLRGTHWRGKDCNDLDASVYPGRALNLEGPSVDHNCNGISGVNPQMQAYEDAFCSGSNTPRGTIVLGDSASAHFGIPAKYLMPDNQNSSSVYANLLPFVEDEADWPQCSWSTAFANDTDCPAHKLPINSIYQRMRARNLCNHRDYQNIGVNGGRTSNMAPPNGIITALQRTKADAPANVFYALIGNDVCGHEQDFSHMTTPAEFLARVTLALQYLEPLLPAGSAVLFMPLVDGRVLYDTLHDKQHPVGVTYSDLYDYLNCLQTSPCWGWMNTNATVRNTTTQIAQSLTAVYPQIVASQKYDSFTMHALTVDWNTIFQQYVKSGRNPVDLIEPTDGFHPSTEGNTLLAKGIWDEISAKWPELLGAVNPNNAAILQQFGAQGGY